MSFNEPAPEQQQAPVEQPAQEPAPQEAPAEEAPAEGGNTEVQELTGQLGQAIRTAQLSSQDAKGVANSILSALEGKVDPSDLNDIQKKVKGLTGGEQQQQPQGGEQPAPAQGAEQPMQEEEVLIDENPATQANQQGSFIDQVLAKAGLEDMDDNPADFHQQILDGMYIFLAKYGKKTPLYAEIQNTLEQNGYDEWDNTVSNVADLDVDGQIIFHTLEVMSREKFGDFGNSQKDFEAIRNPEFGSVAAHSPTAFDVDPKYRQGVNESKGKKIRITEAQLKMIMNKLK